MLIGAKPEAGLDVSEKDRLEAEVKETNARRERRDHDGVQDQRDLFLRAESEFRRLIGWWVRPEAGRLGDVRPLMGLKLDFTPGDIIVCVHSPSVVAAGNEAGRLLFHGKEITYQRYSVEIVFLRLYTGRR